MKRSKLAMLCIILIIFSFSIKSIASATEYQYDKLNRVVQVTYDDGSYVVYTYDANGNIKNIRVFHEGEADSGDNDDGDDSGNQNGDNDDGDDNGNQNGDNDDGDDNGSQNGDNDDGDDNGNQNGNNNNNGNDNGSQTGNNDGDEEDDHEFIQVSTKDVIKREKIMWLMDLKDRGYINKKTFDNLPMIIQNRYEYYESLLEEKENIRKRVGNLTEKQILRVLNID